MILYGALVMVVLVGVIVLVSKLKRRKKKPASVQTAPAAPMQAVPVQSASAMPVQTTQRMFCTQCGEEHDGTNQFCIKCGARIPSGNPAGERE